MLRLIKTVCCVVSMICMGCVAGQMLIPWMGAQTPEDDYAAAQMLLDDFERKGDGLWFRRNTIDPDRVYRALEARLPYAFTMKCKTLHDGSAELTMEIGNRASQEQAETLARGIVQSLQLEGMDVRGQLLALHDWLVVNCAYDLSVEKTDTLDGSSPPFTAVGALVNGSAVCMGYARGYQMLCEAAGIETFFIVSERMNHAWNAVWLDGELLFIDCTYDDPVPDRPGVAGHQYFLINADGLRRTHIWDEAFYERLFQKLEIEESAA